MKKFTPWFLKVFSFFVLMFLSLSVVFGKVAVAFTNSEQEDIELNLVVKSKDGKEIAFPSYLLHLSPYFKTLHRESLTTNNSYYEAENENNRAIFYIEENSELLNLFLKILKELPNAAFNITGQQVNEEDIAEDTIFVSPKVKKCLVPMLKKLSNKDVNNLFLLCSKLEIEPLVNVLAYELALRFSVVAKKVSFKNLEFLSKEISKRFPDFTKMQVKYLIKHLYLLKNNKQEFSLADYIGLHGLPRVRHKVLKCSNENIMLTSLQGIDIISRHYPNLKKLDLSFNSLLSKDFDPNFPKKPFFGFNNLEKINLSHNMLTFLSDDFFVTNSCLKSIDLSFNRLCFLGKAFNKLTSLKKLKLFHNRLTYISNENFSGLDNLKFLDLGHNYLESIPTDLFLPLFNLSSVDLSYNNIMDLAKKDISKLLGENVLVIFEPQFMNN